MKLMKKILILMMFSLCLLSLGYSTTNDAQQYYSLDNSSLSGSNPLDLSGNNNDGTTVGATTGITGILNEAFDFDGTNDKLDFGYTPATVSALTFSTWINSDVTQNKNFFWAWDGGDNRIGASIRNDGTNFLRFFIKDGSSQSTAEYSFTPSNGVWYHLVGTYDGTSTKLYVDGVLRDTKTDASGDIVNLVWDGLGYYSAGSSYFNGQFDEVAVYDRALSLTEVEELYNSGNAFNPYINVSTPPINHNIKDFYNYENISINLTTSSNVNMSYILDDSDLLVNNGLLAYYQAENNANDRFGLNNGTWVGTEAYDISVNSNYGNAFNFDGINSYIDISTIGTLDLHNSDYTICLWEYPTDSIKSNFLFGEGTNNDYIKFGITGSVFIEDSVDTVFSNDYGAGFTLDTWQHVCFVFNSTADTINLCTDGSCRTAVTNTLTATYNVGNIGQSKLTEFYEGNIDELRIYNKTLTPIEINKLYTTSPRINICNDCNITILNLTALSEQGHNIFFYANDLNGETVTTSSFIIDLTPPDIQIIGSIQQNTFEVNFSTIFNVTDNLSGLDTCTLNITYLESNQSDSNFFINCTDTQTFTRAGLYNGFLGATDNAGNSNNVSINGTIIPFVFIKFNDSITSNLISNYEVNIYHPDSGVTTQKDVNSTIILSPINNGVLELGIHTIEFIKYGYNIANYTIEINVSSGDETIFFLADRTTLIIQVFDSTNINNQLNFNITIQNSTDNQVFLNQFNFSKKFNETLSGDLSFIIESEGYSDGFFFNTLNPFTTLNINAYLTPINDSQTIKFFVADASQASVGLRGVLIELQKLINGSWVTIQQGLTGDSGESFIQTDATESFLFIFSKDGFVSATAQSIPGVLDYSVTLSPVSEIFDYVDDISFSFTPIETNLNSNQTLNFTGFISGTGFTSSQFNIYNSSNDLIYQANSTNPTGTTFKTSIFIPINSTQYRTEIIYIIDGKTEVVSKTYFITTVTGFINTAQDYSQDDSFSAKFIRFMVIMFLVVSSLSISRSDNISEMSLFVIPVFMFLTYIGFMMWTQAAALSVLALVFYIGGKR